MSPKLRQLLKDAMSLSEQERADLAGRLIDSLDLEFEAEAAAQWQAEIARRTADLDAGTVKPVPWSKIRQKLMGQLDDASAA